MQAADLHERAVVEPAIGTPLRFNKSTAARDTGPASSHRQIPVRVFGDGMASRLEGRRNEHIGMTLEERDRVLGRGLSEECHSEGCLLPGAGVAEEANFGRRQAFAHAEGDGHRWDELVGSPKGPMRESENRIEVVLLDPDCRVGNLLERRMAKRVAPRLIVGNVTILTPATEGDIGRRFLDRRAHQLGSRRQ